MIKCSNMVQRRKHAAFYDEIDERESRTPATPHKELPQGNASELCILTTTVKQGTLSWSLAICFCGCSVSAVQSYSPGLMFSHATVRSYAKVEPSHPHS